MMAAPALPQAQSGLAAILGAQGVPATPSGETEGFQQLFATLPAARVEAAPFPAPAAPAIAVPVDAADAAQPAVSRAPSMDALLSQPGPAAAPVLDVESPETVAVPAIPAAPTAKPTETEPDPAAAASLLIAVASPRIAAAATGKQASPAVGTKADDADKTQPADGETGEPVTADQPAVLAPIAAEIAAPVQSRIANAASTQAPVEPRLPGSSKPAKPVAASTADKPAPGIAKGVPAQAPEVAGTAPTATKPAADAAPARPALDLGASMTVLFGQPVAQGAAAADIAKAAVPVAERTLDMASDDQWIAQLAADIAATKSESGDLSFRLVPRHLGRLDVAMKLDDGGSVSLKLDTQHEATATIVTAAQPRLVEDLRQQGVRVTEAQVTHTPAETGRQQQQQGQGGRYTAPGTSHLIETAPERPGADRNERAADRRGRFA